MVEVKELRGKEKKELIKTLKDAREELVRLRSSRALENLPDGSVLEKKKKEIARVLTVLKEKEILEQAQAAEENAKKEIKRKN
ncbi:50S ribosomal protein L29 [Candidatus Saccharibacteria bacterium]|nr:50S ribosomal protein L29 [Candidatus Saccharibacteria bacterium]